MVSARLQVRLHSKGKALAVADFKTDEGRPPASHLVSHRFIGAGQGPFCRPRPSPFIPAGTRPHASQMRPQRNLINRQWLTDSLFYGNPETGFADYDFKHMFDRRAHWTAVAMQLYVCVLTAPVLSLPEWDLLLPRQDSQATSAFGARSHLVCNDRMLLTLQGGQDGDAVAAH